MGGPGVAGAAGAGREVPAGGASSRRASLLGLARSDAVEALVRALRTGAVSAAGDVAPYLAPDVRLAIGLTGEQVGPAGGAEPAVVGLPVEVAGSEAVGQRLCGSWPETALLGRGVWSVPVLDAGGRFARVSVSFDGLGGPVAGGELRLAFDDDDRVAAVELGLERRPVRRASSLLPDVVAAVDGALARGAPLVVGYTSGSGRPCLSVGGSVQCFSATQLCLWEREGPFVESLRHDPAVSLLYQDRTTGASFVVAGRAHVTVDPRDRSRVYRMIPEVERHADPEQQGAAVLVDVEAVLGSTPSGPVEIRAASGG